jgi:hypothetical protein
MIRVLAARTAGLLNLADVGRDAGLPHTSLTRYLALLEIHDGAEAFDAVHARSFQHTFTISICNSLPSFSILPAMWPTPTAQ